MIRVFCVLVCCALCLLPMPPAMAEDLRYKVKVTWGVVTEREDGEPVTADEIHGYQLRYNRINDGAPPIDVEIPGDVTTHEITGLFPGTYDIALAMTDIYGIQSNYTDPVIVPAGSRPKKPGPIRVEWSCESGCSGSVTIPVQ